jgi:hypothetical protein
LFLLADFISTAALNARSILSDEAGTPITSLGMGASAGNLCLFIFQYWIGLNDKSNSPASFVTSKLIIKFN